VRHDRIDSPRRRIPSRKHERTLLAVFPSVLILILAASGRWQLLASGLLPVPLLWLAQRLRRGSIRPQSEAGSGSTLDSNVAGLLGHQSSSRGGDDAAEGDLPRPDSLPDTGDVAFDAGLAGPVVAAADFSSATGTPGAKTSRIRDRRRCVRKQPLEPPSARFVMVAPGRYVRVEETEAEAESCPATDREATDNPPGHPDPVPIEPAADDAVDESPSIDSGSDAPSGSELDSCTAPDNQDVVDPLPGSECSAEPPRVSDEDEEVIASPGDGCLA
jgi:hypothetical protein